MKKVKVSICILIILMLISLPTFAIYIAYTIGNRAISFDVTLAQNIEVQQANAPKITNGMIPIVWNSTSSVWEVVSQTETDNWYNYLSAKWANVMLSDGTYIAESISTDENADGIDDVTGKTIATVGMQVAESDLGSMFVWIPRYEYKISNNRIYVKFIKVTDENTTGYITHPAFTDETSTSFVNGGWDTELEGFWAAKFEMSKDSTKGLQSLPNKVAYGNVTATSAYTESLSASYGITDETDISNINSHLMKNSEWGAVRISFI